MDFFEHQADARRRTLLLALYFLLAMGIIVVAVNAVVYALLLWWGDDSWTLAGWLTHPGCWWLSGTLLIVMAGGSLRKLWQLREGGVALASLVGATEVPPDTPVTDEHQLINIVEEMSIASGIPAPRVFVMRGEPAINAFVAGYRPTETVLVTTQGLLDQLDRDEIQGVIAHEFSHVFNADMVLNMRLLAGLAGVVAVGKVGEVLLHGSLPTSHHTTRKHQVSGVVWGMLLGLALMLLGYIGLFFGRLIKAAIARQRELLADASAVQFTRYPDGIANALIKIRNGGSTRLVSAHAEDMSHMCFGESLKFWRLGGLLATHPPVEDRLQAIGPEWPARARARQRSAARDGTPAGPTPAGASAFAGETAVRTDGAGARDVGRVTPANMGYAHSIHESIPADFRRQLHEAAGAGYALYALALTASEADPGELVTRVTDNRVEQQVILDMADTLKELGTRLRLPVLDLALPALKRQPDAERRALVERLNQLVRADRKINLFEFALMRLAVDHLGEHAGRRRKVRFHRLAPVQADCRLLLSLLLHAGGVRGEEAEDIFRRSASGILPEGTTLIPPAECGLDRLDASLKRLQALTPLLQSSVVDACALAITADNRIQVAQAELLRVVCTLLDCPLPPLFDSGDPPAIRSS